MGTTRVMLLPGPIISAADAPRGIQRERRLHGHELGWGVGGFKHYLGHLLSESLGVHGALVKVTRCSSGIVHSSP